MKSEDLRTFSTDIRAEACAWIAQLETGNLKAADIDAFREWVGRSPRHAYEIRQLAQLSGELNVLTEFAPDLHSAVRAHQRAVGPRPAFARIPRIWIATVVVLAAIAVGYLVMRSESQQRPVMFATDVGGYLKQVLIDDSTLELNADSQVQVDYTSTRRTVRLLRGEVLFSVARNPHRPFVVLVGSRSVEALGTAFVIRSDGQDFEVAVTDGTVRVSPSHSGLVDPLRTAATSKTTGDPAQMHESEAAAEQKPVLLSAGQRFAVLARDSTRSATVPLIETLSDEELRRKLAWQQGILEFSGTPLATVIREVARHTKLKIEIADPSLRELRFDGVFRTGHIEPLFQALESAYGIHIVRVDEQTVQLTRGNTG